MWLLALILPLAAADEAAYLACCAEAGEASCPTQLTVIGPGSTVLHGRRAAEVQGVWNLTCTDGAAFFPAAVREAPPGSVEGDIIGFVPQRSLSCFVSSCALPTHLCLDRRAGVSVVRSCDLHAAPTHAELSDVRLVRGAHVPASPAAVAALPPADADADAFPTAAVARPADPPAPTPPAPRAEPAAAQPAPAVTVAVVRAPPVAAPVGPGSTKGAWTAPVAEPASPAASPKPAPSSDGLADWEREVMAEPDVAESPPAPPPAPVAAPPPAAPAPIVLRGPVRPLTQADLAVPPLPPTPCVPNAALRQPSVLQVDAGDEATLAGDPASALGHYRAAITIDACNPFAWAALGHALLGANSPAGAVPALETATRLMPAHFRAWTDLGLARETLQLIPQAVEAYHEALSLQDAYAPARDGLQRTLRQR